MKTIIILSALIMVGCAVPQRYPGWEHVRIQYEEPPVYECVYKVQEFCSLPGARCYNWYKKRATMFDANIVFITQQITTERTERTFENIFKSPMMVAVADYYDCPNSNYIYIL